MVTAIDFSNKDISQYFTAVLKGRSDPLWFAENILGVSLFPTQTEIMGDFYSDDYKRLVLVAGMRCCDENTLISMEDGTTKKLKDGVVGDMVISTASDNTVSTNKVLETFDIGIKEGFKLSVGNKSIVSSNEHKFLTTVGWKQLCDISTSDFIATNDSKVVSYERVQSIECVGHVYMCDLRIDIRENYVGNGISGHNSGKSALASIMTAYEYFLLCTLDDPAKYYGLMPNQLISISCVAASESQAKDTIFSNTRNMIKNSSFFKTWTDTYPKEMELTSDSKHIQIRTISSSATTAVGRSNKAVIFDELANFEESTSKKGAWSIYERLIKSTDTFGGDGHVISISSPRHPTDIMMTLYKRGLEEKNTLALMRPTWDMNPNLTKESLLIEHKYNMQAFWRDYACQPGAYSAVQFPEGVTMDKRIQNVLENTITDNIVPHVLSIDPAIRNDAFGMATAYMDINGRIVVDGCSKFERLQGAMMINPIEVREFIDKKIKELNIHTVVFDVWMFPELYHHLECDLGMNMVKHIVLKEDYDRWRELQTDGLTRVLYDEFLKLETEALVIKNEKKVDHTTTSSKDVSDCVANCMWYLTEDTGIGDVPPIFIMMGH